MGEVELNELVTLLDNHLAAGDRVEPLKAGIAARADRLAALLAGTASPDPKAVLTLVNCPWQRFSASSAGTGRPVLQAMARLAVALPADRQALLPLGLRVLVSVDPRVTDDPKSGTTRPSLKTASIALSGCSR
jgi:hypothetical protein